MRLPFVIILSLAFCLSLHAQTLPQPAGTPVVVPTPDAIPAATPVVTIPRTGASPVPIPATVPTPVVAPLPASPIALPTPPPTGLPLPDDPPPVAPDFRAPVRPLPSMERVGVDISRSLPLSLQAAIEMALANNNAIEITRKTVRMAEFDVRAARGVYDPLLASNNYYESATVPTASAIGGAVNGAVTQTRWFGSGGVSGASPWYGGQYSALFDSSRTQTSNTNALLNPQYPSSLALSYTQPLLRNLFFDNNRRQIEIARRNLGITDAQFRQQAILVISQVEQAYWNLVFALRDLQVQIDAVRQARTQLESNQRMVERGVLAPIDVVAATAQITTFEQGVYSAQQAVTQQENVLKTLLLPDRTSEIWGQAITPTSPISLEPPATALELAVADALRNRPELAQLDASSEINKINVRYYRDQKKPQIDVYGAYTMQGLAGAPTARGLPIVPANLVGGYFDSLGNLIQQDYPTYRFGVAISLPWGNRTAKANLGRALVEGERIDDQRAQAEQAIEAEVRNSMQALRSAQARLASASAARASAEQLYESEQRQFRAGTSTLYLVLQRQNELLVARSRELQAQTDLNRAISEFQRSTGNTLTVNNVTIR